MANDSEQWRKGRKAASRIRGMMLGLALGDTWGAARGALPATGPLAAGVSTQLACFTAEGLIRAMVRGNHRSMCHPPSVVLHAYCRWAALQGIEVEKMRRRWGSGGGAAWPDGWLASVPALARRRGSAPATVAALSRIEAGQDRMATASRGCHALTRTLPVASLGMNGVAQAGEIAALTHSDPAARTATTQATFLTHHLLSDHPLPRQQSDHPLPGQPLSDSSGPADSGRTDSGRTDSDPADSGRTDRRDRQPVLRLLRVGLDRLRVAVPDAAEESDRLRSAFRYAVDRAGDTALLARLAPDATAPAALLGGLYAAASFPGRAEFSAALEFAAGAPDGDSVACVTGALLGAVHGADALPVDLVSRHELAWVLDTLARELLTQLVDSPSGGEYAEGWDPNWMNRYPGW